MIRVQNPFMARKLNSSQDAAWTDVFLKQESLDSPRSLGTDSLFQTVAEKRDRELLLSPELLDFFDREFPVIFRRR